MKKICSRCSKEFVTTSSRKRFCSIKCRHEDKKEYQRKYRFERYRIKNGLPLDTPRLTKPKGSGYIDNSGYKIIYNMTHPNSMKSGKILEHVLIMSNHLSRAIRKDESIHHKNGIRHDNRIENLELRCSHHGRGQTVEDIIEWAKEAFKDYGYKVEKIA